MHSDAEILEQQLPPRQRTWLHLARYAGWALVGAYFVAALIMLVLRFYVLPRVGEYSDTIAAVASKTIGNRVTIGGIEAEWYGFHPRLELSEVRIFDQHGAQALTLPYVSVSIAWRSLLYGTLVPHSLAIDSADLHIRRDPAGRFLVAGLEVRPADRQDGSPGIAEALLRVGEVVIRDSAVEWEDEQRRAVPLKIERLNFLLQNDGRSHRFALSGEPPRDLASALDIRGELIGRSLDKFDQWDGQVYAAFEYIDLSAWKTWIDYPFEIASGRGALRLWATLRDWMPTALTADVSMAEVSARFGHDLPAMELKWVKGRLAARAVLAGFELLDLGGERDIAYYEASGHSLGLETRSGVTFNPGDFQGRWDPPSSKGGAKGTVTATSVDLQPLAIIGATMPFPQDVHGVLTSLSPRGRLEDVRFAWTGEIENPASFTARAKFSGLGMQPYGHLPGFADLAGTLDLTEKGGAVAVNAPKASIDYPEIFAEERVAFDTLAAQVAWTLGRERIDVRIDNVSVANADIVATASGSYHTLPDGPGYIDIATRISRADGRFVHRYIPFLRPGVATWLKNGIIAAQLSDGRVRLKGPLKDFPYDDPKVGIFDIAAKFANGTLAYADGWPHVTDMRGEFTLAGRQIRVTATKGATLGVQLSNARATIPDLFSAQRKVVVEARGEGANQDFLTFVARSPVRDYTERIFDSWKMDGRGKLAFNIEVPLDDPAKARMSGSYLVQATRLVTEVSDDPITQLSGRLEFGDAGVSARNLTGQWLGGSLSVDVTSRAEGGVSFGAQGTANVATVLRSFGLPFAGQITGTTAYRFNGTLKGSNYSEVFDSELQGVTIDLPPPFAKSPGESWPLRAERTASGEGAARRHNVTASLGKVLNAQAQIRVDSGRMAVERAAIGVGDVGVALPDRPGVFVSTNLKTLDLDRFFAIAGAEAGAPTFELSALNIRAGELIVAGRLFHDVNARAIRLQPNRWQSVVDSKELAGEVAYGAEGQGAVAARLKRLIHPEYANPAAAGVAQSTALESLPALSIVADSYTFHGHNLGKLDLRAANERRGWRVDKLTLTSEDCTLNADGLWTPQAPAAPARTDFGFSIDVTDIGKCLDRLGYPETVSRGTAKLSGKANWNGPVYAINFPTLTGTVNVEADKGQFVKVKPGIGKLLGVLSLQSLPRRITLDFRDVFSEGFAFDSIRGTAAITAGVMTTNDLAMVGPAASVAITGRADLARETQDLSVRVVPTVGDSVAAAAGVALLNPIIGAGVFLAQRLFKDPIGRMLAFEYHITGSWEDPKVEKTGGPQVAAEQVKQN